MQLKINSIKKLRNWRSKEKRIPSTKIRKPGKLESDCLSKIAFFHE